MISDFFYGFVLMAFSISTFFSGAAAGAKAARCIFWPLSIVLFLTLLVIGVRT